MTDLIRKRRLQWAEENARRSLHKLIKAVIGQNLYGNICWLKSYCFKIITLMDILDQYHVIDLDFIVRDDSSITKFIA